MNKLKLDKQIAVIGALVEGNSIRSTERMTGVHRDTIMRLLVRVGTGCERLLDESMRDLNCRHIQVDEIWAFVGKKQGSLTPADNPRKLGDIWTWIALDADTKLIPAYRVDRRSSRAAHLFLGDLAGRINGRVQLSSDAHKAYITAAERAFGSAVDYGQIVKSYESTYHGAGRYSPPKVVAAKAHRIYGYPDPAHISTSYVERANLSLRMSCRRFTRLTNAFSKRLENLKAAVALHFAHYNFVRVHQTLGVTPAMEAGVSPHLWTIRELIEATTSNPSHGG